MPTRTPKLICVKSTHTHTHARTCALTHFIINIHVKRVHICLRTSIMNVNYMYACAEDVVFAHIQHTNMHHMYTYTQHANATNEVIMTL